jgi:hypothetical protein
MLSKILVPENILQDFEITDTREYKTNWEIELINLNRIVLLELLSPSFNYGMIIIIPNSMAAILKIILYQFIAFNSISHPPKVKIKFI